MACFLVPTTEAIVTTVIEKSMKSKEAKKEKEFDGPISLNEVKPIPFSRKLKWLNNMLWGGSGLLAFEHLWHGEVVPFFPFLTAVDNANELSAMLHEMATTGVTMAVLVTLVWAGMVAVSNVIEKRPIDSLGVQKIK